ncbi:MAG: DNA-binding NtrC family response regulator, partial [Roseivirga sp.]
RDKDILLIAKHLLSTFAKENNLGKMTISREAQHKLLK